MSLAVFEKIKQKNFDRLGGVKLKLVHPTDSEVQKRFYYRNVAGALEAHLANFGKYQYGTSINAPLYLPRWSSNGCEQILEEEWTYAALNKLNFNGFVILETGDCSYETKARNVERLGGQVALIIDLPTAELEDEDFDEAAQKQQFNNGEKPEEFEIPDWVIFDNTYDGTGSSVHIPTILIPFKEGYELLNIVRAEESDGKQVVLKADLDISRSAQQSVKYELFYGSILDLPS